MDVVRYGDIPDPRPKPGEVLVRVRACAINHLDIWVRRGWPGLKLDMPHWCGADVAGEIAGLGEGVSGWKTGQRVVVDPGINRFEVVDNVGKATINTSLKAVTHGGRIVIIGNTSGPHAEIDIRFIFGKQISLIGSTMGSHQDFREVLHLLRAGRLRPVIDRVMPLSQGREAYETLERGEQFEKIVLTP